ncbi:MAG: hypothetical protein M3348_00070 [Acidobacteriota bacterium]|nr:hypothetical protein [Acidobacteriota bacterium]
MTYQQREQPTFEEFLKRKAASIVERVRRGEDTRACVSVQMVRRARWESLSDRFGRFSPNGTLRWLDENLSDETAKIMRGMRSLSVVGPAVAANLAAMVTADVRLTVEAGTKDPKAKGVASVAEGIRDFLDGHEDHWSDTLEARINTLSQTGAGYFVRSRHNPNKAGERVTEQLYDAEAAIDVPGEYACANCDAGGPFTGEIERDEETGLATTECPECGEEAEVVEAPGSDTMPKPGSTRETRSGDSETSVHTHFECRVDERRTQGGELRKALWFEHHYLASRDEIEQENPNFDPGSPAEWSFALKWLHALESGSSAYLNKWPDDAEAFEVREICLLREEYANYRCPEGGGYVLADSDGRPVLLEDGSEAFRIEPGQRITDIFPDSFRFRLTGDRILPGSSEDPGIKAYDFRDEWSYGGFRPDGYSFWYRPLAEALTLQDDVTVLYTMDFEQRARAKSKFVYDQTMFDDSNLDWEYVPTSAPVEANGDIARHFAEVAAPRVESAAEGLQMLLGIADRVGLPPPAATGAADTTDPTYHGQLLKRNAALGLLAPSQESKAKAKVSWFKQQLKIAQRCWPVERFKYLKTRFGEEWKESDIEAFREADLDKVLIVSYADGSEVPQTLVEREQKLGAVLTQLLQALPALAEAGEFAGDLRELVSQYFELAGIDYDFGNVEGQLRLAQARYDELSQIVESARTPDDVAVQLEAHPRLEPFDDEDHAVMIEFWADRARAIMSRPELSPQDLLLAASCQTMIQKHKQLAGDPNQTAPKIAESMNYKDAPPSIQRQMEAAAGFQPAEDAQPDAGPQIEAAKVQTEQQRTAVDAAKVQSERERTATDAAHKARESAAQRAHDAGEAAKDRAHEAGIKAMELASRQQQQQQQASQA